MILPESESSYSTGFSPRPYQRDIYQKLKRFSVLVCHRRFGKSVFAINLLVDRAMRCSLPNPQFYFIAPTFAQAKRISWQYLKTFTANIPGVEFNEADLRCTFPHNNAKIALLSAENYNSIRGVYADGVVMDELADMSPMVWQEAVRPTLSDRHGWVLFCGTPRGTNHFKELYDYGASGRNSDWFSAMFKASETGIVPESELKSARDTMDPDTYLQEYECSFAAGLTGAYFTKDIEKMRQEGRITRVPYDSALLVDTAWDLGISDSTTIWFCQMLRGVPRFIDYYEVSGQSIPEIVADLQKKNYVWGDHMLPHDGAARDLSTGRSIEQLLYSLGLRRVRVIPRVGQKREGINAARMMLSKAIMDEDKCAKGINALWNYRRKWNEKNQCFDEAPLHDWASHGADGFQTAALGLRDDLGLNRANILSSRTYDGSYPLVSDTDYNPFAYKI